MKSNYELRQAILDKWERDMLIEKIVKLEKRIGELELQLRKVHHNPKPKYFILNTDR